MPPTQNREKPPFWNKTFSDDALILAPYDIPIQSKVNDVSPKIAEDALRMHLSEPLEYFCTESMRWNFEKYRAIVSIGSIKTAAESFGEKEPRFKGELLNIVCEKWMKPIAQCWGVYVFSDSLTELELSKIPLRSFKEFQQAQKAPAVLVYDEKSPWKFADKAFVLDFWECVRKTPLYEMFLAYYSDVRFSNWRFSLKERLLYAFMRFLRKLFLPLSGCLQRSRLRK